jgi:hypothetical protein
MIKRTITFKTISQFLLVVMIAATGNLYAQKPDFDANLSQKEIEVMKSIISTSLSLVRQDSRGNESRGRRFGRFVAFDGFSEGSVSGYYLYGQGVVFSIPFPCVSGKTTEEWEEAAARLADLSVDRAAEAETLYAEMALMQSQLELERQNLEMWRLEEGQVLPAPPSPPEPPSPPDEPAVTSSRTERDPEARKKEMAKRIAKMKERLDESRQKSEEFRQQAEQERAVLREELVRVIATHGDSMTHVKDNEYINLLLRNNCEPFGWNRSDEKQTILSIKKSDVKAYRSGQITLDQFKAKILEYAF